MGVWFAHSPSESGRVETVRMHLEDVAERAAQFGMAFGAAEEAYLAGLLHDLGKYGDLFQKRLRGEASGIDHWSAGAAHAVTTLQGVGVASAMAIAGHHLGIPGLSKGYLRRLSVLYRDDGMTSDRRLSCSDPQCLASRAREEGVKFVDLRTSLYDYQTHLANGLCTAAGMLDIRMLYSALVDADFVETEAHFRSADGEKRYHADPPRLQPEVALNAVLEHVAELRTRSLASSDVAVARESLLSACINAAEASPGLFTLTAPTGAGKTLSMLAFALAHAARHRLDRIILVVPYLSILEQTAGVYRTALGRAFSAATLNRYLLEDHSLAGSRSESERASAQNPDDDESWLVTASRPSWNAPLVLTTSVQMLESLFANRPRACRKLHRLARSVLLFDEVQTLPLRLAVPTLATLSHLSSKFGTSIVFSTATQPAFSDLDAAVRPFAGTGWEPKEIVPPESMKLKRRVSVVWPAEDGSVSWEEVAEQMLARRQSLCIVNLKKHAVLLFELLRARQADGLFHLSTNMCPNHRMAVLSSVRRALQHGKPCRLVATQCVEAGVDLDFPEVMRAFAPLDAIVQAAGRCNRNGTRKAGTVRVFVPNDERYPDDAYRRAADVTRLLLRSAHGRLDLDNPQQHRDYYSRLYSVADPASLDARLADAIGEQDFEEVATSYRLIDRPGIEVLVPWRPEVFSPLAEEARSAGLTADWVRRAREHAVNLFRPGRDALHRFVMEPVREGAGRSSSDWFIYLEFGHYDPDLGLVVPDGFDVLIA